MSAAGRGKVEAKTDLKVDDVVFDPIGSVTGVVVSLIPQGNWTDGSLADRVCVQWRWAGWRSDPRITELEKIL